MQLLLTTELLPGISHWSGEPVTDGVGIAESLYIPLLMHVCQPSVTRDLNNNRACSCARYTTINGSASPSTHSCLRIIAAFPPNKASLAVFDLDSRQRAVFDRVRFIQYISGLIKFPNNTKNFGFYVRGLKVTGEMHLVSGWSQALWVGALSRAMTYAAHACF